MRHSYTTGLASTPVSPTVINVLTKPKKRMDYEAPMPFRPPLTRLVLKTFPRLSPSPWLGHRWAPFAASKGYFQRIREICDQNDILLILDEVMAGGGRCGSYFAFERGRDHARHRHLREGVGWGLPANWRMYRPPGNSRHHRRQSRALFSWPHLHRSVPPAVLPAWRY